MSNGYLVAAQADMAAARALGDGFELEVLELSALSGDAALALLSGAANVGVLLSSAGQRDAGFSALVDAMAKRLPRVQLIVVDAEALQAARLLPQSWAALPLSEAQRRAHELTRRRQAPPPPPPTQPEAPRHAAPLSPTPHQGPSAAGSPDLPALSAAAQEPSTPVVTQSDEIAHAADALAEESDEADDDEVPSPEAVRAYVRAQMRAFYDDKQQIAPIRDAIDQQGLSAFAAYNAAHGESAEEFSNAAIVVRALGRLALGALYAEGVNITTAGFAAISERAAALVGANDLDGLADAMREASLQGEDPIAMVAAAAEGLKAAPLPAVAQAPTPADGQYYAPEPEASEPVASSPVADEPAHDAPFAEALPAAEATPPAFGSDAPAPMEETSPTPPAPVPFEPPPAPQSAAPPPMSLESKKAGADHPVAQDSIARAAPRAGGGLAPSPKNIAPADATAFAPKKLRRGTPELIQIAIHQPSDLRAVIKAARKADARASAAPQSMHIGDVALGAHVGVSLEVRGAACDGAVQRRVWTGAPLTFAFAAEADGDVKQAVFLARVFVDDAQIGVVAFTRPIASGNAKPADTGDAGRLQRFKRVFLSYSSKDRATVSAIATAYDAAGVAYFWDRSSLKSGEEWSPRLRQEIDRADLFHLCWSKAASQSEWVITEAEHALTRRKRSNGKQPAITVQMLDGPPWAPHPISLDSINFDDFVRAAIVGYARGDDSGA